MTLMQIPASGVTMQPLRCGPRQSGQAEREGQGHDFGHREPAHAQPGGPVVVAQQAFPSAPPARMPQGPLGQWRGPARCRCAAGAG